jgi:hypothetical protein
MDNLRKPPKLVVFWESVEDPDPEAIAKAFRMLFVSKKGQVLDGFDKTGERAIVQGQS